MGEPVQWENGLLSIPITAEMVPVLDKAGEEGWEPWAVVGVDEKQNHVRIAVKRHKRKISLSTDINGALNI